MIFKKVEGNDIVKNKEVEVLNKLFDNSAILKKNTGWNSDGVDAYSDEPSLTSNVRFVDDNFYVTYGADNENDYTEYLSWNSVMSSIQAPWDAENKQYDFFVQGQRVTEFIAVSVNPERFNDKLDYDNFAILMKGETGDGFTDLDSNGNADSTHAVFAPYFVKSSLGDSRIDQDNQSVKHSNRITPAYDIRTSSDNSFFNYSEDLDAINIDWDVGTISDQLGVFYPSLGLILLFPELMSGSTALNTLKSTIDGASDKSLVSTNSTMMVMGYGVTKKTRTIVFSRFYNNEFNYTTNPTAFTLIGGEPRFDEYIDEEMVTFPTKIGYYNDMNELLAVAHFSQPFKKSPEEELIIISNIEE